MHDPVRMESIHDYTEREADEARQEQRLDDYARFVDPQYSTQEKSEDQDR